MPSSLLFAGASLLIRLPLDLRTRSKKSYSHPAHPSTMAERYIPEHRRTQFKAKNTFKPEELRRRREEQQVEIRKAKREENLAKRRGLGTGENRPGASLGAAPDSDDDTAPTESQVWKLLSSTFCHFLYSLTPPAPFFSSCPSFPLFFVYKGPWARVG